VPYKRIGRIIYTKSSGKWKKKQVCRSVENAEGALRLLRGIEHGTVKKRK